MPIYPMPINIMAIDPKKSGPTTDVITNAANTYKYMAGSVQTSFQNIQSAAARAFLSFQDKIELTPLPPIIVKANSFCSDAEKILNIAGSVPGLGFISGSARYVFGNVQVITGIGLLSLSEIGRFIVSSAPQEGVLGKKWEVLSKVGMEYTLHGCLNVLRGSAEVIVGKYTFGFGNAIFLVPNMINGRDFNPYFAYSRNP